MTGGPLTIIAEAGVNHNGELDRALEMVALAADAGADYVKFQIFDTDRLVARSAPAADYQSANTGQANQSDLLRGLELDLDAFASIAKSCREQKIGFLCTAFDEDTIETLVSFGMDCIKIASGELTNTPALTRFARLGLPVYLSTGMANLDEVGTAVGTLRRGGAGTITALQCTSLYPAPVETLNLRAMATMARALNVPVGFSDHSLGHLAAIAAVALGAVAIEKHFTLDRNLPGPDHKASLEPREFTEFVSQLRQTRISLGDGRKRPTDAELETATKVRRSWHATVDLPAGATINATHIVLMRPASGLAPDTKIVGSRVVVPVAAGDAITADHLA